jgi:hypothetical protein
MSPVIVSLFRCETWSISKNNRHCGWLGKIKRNMTEGVAGQWRQLHNDKLNNLYFVENIANVIKSRWVVVGMTWSTNMAHKKCVKNFKYFMTMH